MDENEQEEKQGGGGKRLSLSSLPSARKALARVAREFWRGSINPEQARVMGYLLSQLVGAFKTETEARIEQRLDDIESRIATRDRFNQGAPLGPDARGPEGVAS